MGFIQSLTNSWKLIKGSLKLIWENPKLFAFPILGFISLILFILLLVSLSIGSSALFLSGTEEQVGTALQSLIIIAILAFLFVSPFLGTFFAVALSFETGEVLKGKSPSIKRGVQHAINNLGEIVLWALTLFLINLLQAFLRQQARRYGGTVGRVIGDGVIDILMAGWGFATAFVIPIMAFEDTNPFDSIKKSVKLLKHTWGETLVGGIGAGSVLGLLIIPLVLLVFIPFVGIFFIPVLIFGIIIISLLTQVFNTVFMTALYLYAMEKDSKKAEKYFDKDLILNGFY